MPLARDLLQPDPAEERRRCKLKRLVQHPNSFFMDVKCPGCYKITTVFSHAQTVVVCVGCNTVLCQPTGGKAKLTEESRFQGSVVSGTCLQKFLLLHRIYPSFFQAVRFERNSIDGVGTKKTKEHAPLVMFEAIIVAVCTLKNGINSV
uniref:40S ribosomal protein S27 n=1 Tax=Romanomermis culicivorax TaxID=13658 RepID=A0A915JG17_ROMCU